MKKNSALKMKKYSLLYFMPFFAILLLIGIFIFDANLKLKSNDKNFKLNSVLIGEKIPEIYLDQLGSFSTLETKDFFASGYKIVNFWASWCGPCRAEHPLLMELSKDGHKIYGINYKDKEINAMKFLGSLGNPYGKLGQDTSGRMAIYWGLYGVPETFIVDNSGTVVYRHAGPMTKKIFNEEILPKMSK